MNMLPYSGIPALPKNIEDMHAQLVALGLNDVRALAARISKCEAWVDTVEETELTGNPVTFNNALAVPAIDCEATLSPIQDLHGYDHPWAGGAGKNLLPMTVAGIKAANAGGTWSGNVYTVANGTFEILSDDSNINIHGIKVNGTFNANIGFYITTDVNLAANTYIVNGCPSGLGENVWQGFYDGSNYVQPVDTGSGATHTLSEETHYAFRIRIGANVALSNVIFYPMVRLATVSDATFAPYSNICPISGRTEARVDTENEDSSESAYATIQLGQTVYGAEVDFTEGTAEVTDGYIASYDGETLPSTWISDRDVYAEGTTPTTGAEVVYKLATPTTIQLTPTQLEMLKGYNRVSSTDADSLTVKAYTGGPWEAVTRTIKKVTNKTKTTKKRRK